MATRIVWLTFIAAMDENGFVQFASPSNVAHRSIVPLPEVLTALAALEGPDANSSDPDNEGRRVEKVPGGWMVLNAAKYREIVTRANAQERTKNRVRRHREQKRLVTLGNAIVTAGNESVTPSEAEVLSEAESHTNNRTTGSASPPSLVLLIPSIETVAAYCLERCNGIDPQQFVDHYAANGWMRGKNRIKDWRACIRTWEAKRRAKAQGDAPSSDPAPTPEQEAEWDRIARGEA